MRIAAGQWRASPRPGHVELQTAQSGLDKNGKATARTVKAVTALASELAGGVRGAKRKG